MSKVKYFHSEVFVLDKNHSVIAEFSIIPWSSSGSSVGRYVAAAVNALKNVKGLDFVK